MIPLSMILLSGAHFSYPGSVSVQEVVAFIFAPTNQLIWYNFKRNKYKFCFEKWPIPVTGAIMASTYRTDYWHAPWVITRFKLSVKVRWLVIDRNLNLNRNRKHRNFGLSEPKPKPKPKVRTYRNRNRNRKQNCDNLSKPKFRPKPKPKISDHYRWH